ncbi:toxin [Streptomyces sp. NRRL S-444]|nr:toxin [Streptomyces sp. NRRL S-444]
MAELDWFKSSYSDSSDINDCVEVANTPDAVLVRDSKDIQRDHLAFGPRAWAGFVAHASGV